MHSFTRAADRTRSPRWRAGTRRNKRYSTLKTFPCDNPKYCLIHATVTHPKRPPAMAMMLTRCERAWVNDVIAGRPHIHVKRQRRGSVHNSNQIDLMALLYRINPPEVVKNEVTLVAHGRSAMGHPFHVPPGGVVAPMDISDRWYPRDSGYVVGMDYGYTGQHRAMGYDVVQYGPMQTGRSR